MYSEDENWPYSVLGLDQAPDDLKSIKRAYAHKLKTIDQSTQAEDFQNLRTAFDAAKQFLTYNLAAKADEANETNGQRTDAGNVAPFLPLDHKSDQPSTTALVEQLQDAPSPSAPTPPLELNTLEELPVAGNKFLLDDAKCIAPKTLLDLEEKILKLPRDKNGVAFLLDLLNSAIMEDPQARPRVEAAIYAYMQKCLTVDAEDHPKFRLFINDEILEAIELQFNWQSDILSLQRKFWDAGDLVAALVYKSTLYQEEAEDENETQFELDPVGKAVTKLALIPFLVMVLSKFTPTGSAITDALDSLFAYSSKIVAAIAVLYLTYRVTLLGWNVVKNILKYVMPSMFPQKSWSDIFSYQTLGLFQIYLLSIYLALPEGMDAKKHAFSGMILLLIFMVGFSIFWLILSLVLNKGKALYHFARSFFKS
ncbi:hypothetical protein [Pseudovibrio sp. Ad37]|uniref:hypothetical protein n=1 Tax=Pseudovibrio sp. Ad37 TaxID=989422 RepID=UPI0007AE4F7C|nr:hypothetical protein [Pseudovibrio sp. Ad37]KZL15024.1 hypothetical protein PsAD37_04559 [Pseudovibrio sp. Ad37]